MTAIDINATRAAAAHPEPANIPPGIVLLMTAGALATASILLILVGLVAALPAMTLTGTLVLTASIITGIHHGINALAEA